MEVYYSISECCKQSKSTIVTIGAFDGMHIGHQDLLKTMISEAKKNNLKTIVITFDPSPKEFFGELNKSFRLMTLCEKIDKMKQVGIDCLIIHPFSKEFSNYSFDIFINSVLSHLNVSVLYLGFNNNIGKKDNTNDLYSTHTHKANITKLIHNQLIYENETVSSTQIRKLIDDGQIEKANFLLADIYSICGKVVSGYGMGRKMGTPTINIKMNYEKMLPPNGVYMARVTLEDFSTYDGVMNIGLCPTFERQNKAIEVHLLNFNKNIYNQNVKIRIYKKIRNEQKFSSVNDLIAQISSDISCAKCYFTLNKEDSFIQQD